MGSIRLEDLTKSFADGTVAVREVSFEINPGELMVVVGPSGCGKTTTLRIVGGLEVPDKGRVFFGDRDVTDVPAEDRGAGIVFQQYALFPNMDVFRNVEFGLRIRRIPPDVRRQRVQETLEMVRIADLANKMPQHLSGGQQQRVALARALAIEPQVLLLDEPLTALDAKLREELRLELALLQRRLKITTIYVTHDQTEAMSLGDRIAVMNAGQIEQIGTPFDIYHRPQNTFVASFIGTTNLKRGKVVDLPGRCGIDVGFAFFELEPERVRRHPPEVSVMFRPEGVALAERSGTAPDFHARVKERFFLGDKVRLFLLTDSGEEIIADVDNLVETRPGDRLSLTVARHHLTVF